MLKNILSWLIKKIYNFIVETCKFAISLILIYLLSEYGYAATNSAYKITQVVCVGVVTILILWAIIYTRSTFSLEIWEGLKKFISDIRTNKNSISSVFKKFFFLACLIIILFFLKSCLDECADPDGLCQWIGDIGSKAKRRRI
jgi:hypothetical protein